jgi:putative transposase
VLQLLTKRLLEAELDGEPIDHLGYDKHDPADRNGVAPGNGVRSKTVLTDVGPVRLEVPRDRDADVSRQTISTITDKAIEGMVEWQNRPRDPVLFIDAIHVKIRDGQVVNRPVYVARGHLRGLPGHPRTMGG